MDRKKRACYQAAVMAFSMVATSALGCSDSSTGQPGHYSCLLSDIPCFKLISMSIKMSLADCSTTAQLSDFRHHATKTGPLQSLSSHLARDAWHLLSPSNSWQGTPGGTGNLSSITLAEAQIKHRHVSISVQINLYINWYIHICMSVRVCFLVYVLLVCLFVCLLVCLFVCSLVCLLVCLFVFLLVCWFVCLFVCLRGFLFACQFVCLFVCLLCLSICCFLSIYSSACLLVYGLFIESN